MSSALLEQLHAAELSSTASPTAVRDLLTAWAPQLLQLEQLVAERSQLLAKNEQARSRVEAMITRLKSLEQHT